MKKLPYYFYKSYVKIPGTHGRMQVLNMTLAFSWQQGEVV